MLAQRFVGEERSSAVATRFDLGKQAGGTQMAATMAKTHN